VRPEPNLESGANIDCCKLYRENREVRQIFVVPMALAEIRRLGVYPNSQSFYSRAAGLVNPTGLFRSYLLISACPECFPAAWFVSVLRRRGPRLGAEEF